MIVTNVELCEGCLARYDLREYGYRSVQFGHGVNADFVAYDSRDQQSRHVPRLDI